MVPHPNGGVLVYENGGPNIYMLPHAGPDAAWILLPQRVKSPRTFTNAFLVPDELVTCN
jgi:hypothetical protein